ncbi:amino acid ABC transporter substrate-binding protein [Rhodophyticola sp. CCM32]|uniref:ABC transporter substrate-binding protein n=1 Tax=Rhodophyticola sp. CCM32 TaxID=2916397 RepID=UPI00107EF62C|nr:ABC transporter substrate-binding protein [Rhodophyticola sp. CCM32]QBX99905.1 amino acid ABC transporter substrate-binding protein [Rhodophyticola sp. CCM32]
MIRNSLLFSTAMATGMAGMAMADGYTIGVMSAQSGYLAPYDGPAYAGFQFCIDEMNANGGLNGTTPVELIVRDTRSDIAEGVKVVQEMIDEGAQFIVASADADPTIAAAQITAADSIPTMTFAGTAPVLTQVGEHVFGSYPADNQQATVLAGYALDQGLERVWLVKSPDSAYTLGGPEYFGEVFSALGGSVVGESSYSLNQPDFSAIVTTIANADPAPDVIVTWAWEPDFPAFIRALRGAGLDTQVMGGDVLDTPTVRGLGDVVAGVTHTSGGFPDEGSAYADFIERFTAATGTTPDNNYYVNGCDIAHMIEDAVAAAGTTDPAAVTAAMAAIEDGEGIMSNFTFAGTDRMPLRDVVVARISETGEKEFILRSTADPALLPQP